jgi:hypothetical protein
MRSVRWVSVVAVAFGCLLASACAGEVDTNAGPPAACGPVSCSGAEYCCDATCGLCVADEVACTAKCGE